MVYLYQCTKTRRSLGFVTREFWAVEERCSRLLSQSVEPTRGLAEQDIGSEQSPQSGTPPADVFGYRPRRPSCVDIARTIKTATQGETMRFMTPAKRSKDANVLVEPSPPQRKYLASISQGYFLFHLLGHDPKFCEVQKDIFRKTLWFCDSSVLLPLIATGCHNHDYVVELFQTLADETALLCTTPKLLQEAWEHFQWALDFVRETGIESSEFIRAALVKGSYRQNLFLDGYIILSADGKVGTFNDYIGLIFPDGRISRTSFDRAVSRNVLRVIKISDLDGFDQNDWGND